MGETVKLFDESQVPTIDLSVVRDQLRQHIEETGKSQSDIAKSIGRSEAAFSQFLNGTYSGNMNDIATRVVNYLNRQEKRLAAPKEPEFVQTSIAGEVLTVADFTHTHRTIGLIYGDAGVGKTLALQQYAQGHKGGVILLRARVDLKSAGAIITELMEQIGKREYGSRRVEVNAVIQALKGSGNMIIIDEAQRLSYGALEMLRDIHDEAGVGLLLVGNRDIYERMRGKKGVLFAQLFSRVGIRRCLQCKDILKQDTQMIFEQHAKLDKDCLEYLHRIAEQSSGGGLRQAKDFYVLGMVIARGMKKDNLDMECLHCAKEMLMGK